MSMFDLGGRGALVTGATQGPGPAIARALAGQGTGVAMLASRAGDCITGHNLVVDGGTTISDGSQNRRCTESRP